MNCFETFALSEVTRLQTLFAVQQQMIVLTKWLHRAELQEGKFAVLYLDLDKFKLINDVQGHSIDNRRSIHVHS